MRSSGGGERPVQQQQGAEASRRRAARSRSRAEGAQPGPPSAALDALGPGGRSQCRRCATPGLLPARGLSRSLRWFTDLLKVSPGATSGPPAAITPLFPSLQRNLALPCPRTCHGSGPLAQVQTWIGTAFGCPAFLPFSPAPSLWAHSGAPVLLIGLSFRSI